MQDTKFTCLQDDYNYGRGKNSAQKYAKSLRFVVFELWEFGSCPPGFSVFPKLSQLYVYLLLLRNHCPTILA